MRNLIVRISGLVLIGISLVAIWNLETLAPAYHGASIVGLILGAIAFLCGSCGVAGLFSGARLFQPDDSPRSHRHHSLERDG